MMLPSNVPTYDVPLATNGKTIMAWYRWFQSISPSPRFSGTITTAKLTTAGKNGSMTFVNGICTTQVQAT